MHCCQSASDHRGSLGRTIFVARAAGPAARTWRLRLIVAGAGSDRRGDHIEGDARAIVGERAIAIAAFRRGAIIAITRCGTLAGRASRSVVANNAFGALRTILARTLFTLGAFGPLGSIVTGAALVAILALRPIGPFRAI